MAEKAVAEVGTPSYAGVSVEHPRIVEAIKAGAKNGLTKEQVQKVVGMPMEVIEKHYKK